MRVVRSESFKRWLNGLRDVQAQGQIVNRLLRLSEGHLGDIRPVGSGLSELRIHSGPGYRLYCFVKGQEFIVLLAGGDKSSQARDIRKARDVLADWEDGHGD